MALLSLVTSSVCHNQLTDTAEYAAESLTSCASTPQKGVRRHKLHYCRLLGRRGARAVLQQGCAALALAEESPQAPGWTDWLPCKAFLQRAHGRRHTSRTNSIRGLVGNRWNLLHHTQLSMSVVTTHTRKINSEWKYLQSLYDSLRSPPDQSPQARLADCEEVTSSGPAPVAIHKVSQAF
jgi:hypothetical protein